MNHVRFLPGLIAIGVVLLSTSCRVELDQADLEAATSQRIDVYFNYPGVRAVNGLNTEADDILVQMIDRANNRIDFAIMGFSRQSIVDALVRAYLRGVDLRFVGDARHAHGTVLGYLEMDYYNVPMQNGNQSHIMHNKFFIIDDLFVVTGTGNITGTGFDHNNNNWVVIESPEVAADFQAEFDQMFGGRFGFAKQRNDNGTHYQIGDSLVEVYFSPQEDTMGRLLRAIEEANYTIEFTIFAFTKDQVGSLLIDKHQEFQQYNQCCDPDRADEREDPDVAAICSEFVICEEGEFRERYVRGVIDRSQLHSNGPYHELYRLVTYGVPMVLDGNDNSRNPGDYQAGGGRQHAKTMVIDAGRESATVVSGSFNWSSSATVSNDETLLVISGERLSLEYAEYFEMLWQQGSELGQDWIGNEGVQPGDVIFNEIGWDGYNCLVDVGDAAGDLTYNDEFIELLNTTDRPIDLSLWTIATDDDFVVGLYPGTIIGPHERFFIADHNTQPYTDLEPQRRDGAFIFPDFVMNMANDQRFLRLNLRNARFSLRLLDPRGNEMDAAGDGGPPFAGGRQQTGIEPIDFCDANGVQVFSMERIHTPCEGSDCQTFGDGRSASSWQACTAEQGGAHVRDRFRPIVIATPGEANSANAYPIAEDPTYRSANGNYAIPAE